MKLLGVLYAALLSLAAFGSQAQAQPAAPNIAPSMPPADIRAKKILCNHSKYLRPGYYEWDRATERWIWQRQDCIKKPSYWHEGCSWRKGYWEPVGQGARYSFGAVSCPPKKKVTPPPVVAPKKKVEKKVSPKVAAPKTVEKKEMPILAVFDIEVVDLKLRKSFRTSLADFVAMRMTETRTFQVLPRSQLKQRLIQSN